MISKKSLQSYFGEFMCTTIFGYAVYSAIMASSSSLSISGLIVGISACFATISVVYTFMDISPCHFNPAITFAAMIFKFVSLIDGIMYITMQISGFFCAALLVCASNTNTCKETLQIIRPKIVQDTLSDYSIFTVEMILTFILTLVVFSVGINSKRNPDLSLYGDEPLKEKSVSSIPLAVGFTLGFLVLIGSITTGGAFNPGITFAPAMLSLEFENTWLYILSQFLGGIIAGGVQIFLLFK